MLNLKLSKNAEISRIIKGINLADLEVNVKTGIKVIESNRIISSYNNLIIHHLRLGSIIYITKIMSK